MKRVSIIIAMLLFSFHIVNAQTSCDETIERAKLQYKNGQYEDAKKQFQAAIIICDSEIAKEYIQLCNEHISLNDAKLKLKDHPSPNEPREDSQRITELENRISNLQADSTQRATTINTYAEKMLAKNNTIDSLKEVAKQSVDLTNRFENEREAFYGSLRDLGIELNAYLEKKLNNNNKKKIEDVDTISNDSLVIVLKRNIKLVNEIIAFTWF